MVNASPLPGVDDGGSSPTSCSAGIYSSFGSANSQTESLRIGAAARPQHAEFGLRPTYQHSERTHLPTLIEERLRNLLGEPLSDADRASVRLAPLRSCLTGEIVAVQDSDGVLRYGKVKDEEAAGEVKVQVSKACIRWCAVSQIYFFQAVNRARQSSKEVDVWTGNKEEEGESSTVSVIAEVNALLARLNVSLSTSYEELLAELLRLQHRAVLAEEDRRVAL